MEAKKLLLRWAVSEAIGYDAGREQEGMKIELVDIRKAFLHADARREVCRIA